MDKETECKILMKKIMKGIHHLQTRGISTEPLRFDKEQRDFIIASMTQDVCEDVIRTLNFHEQCQRAGIDDGRRYWCFKYNNRIIGINGYHYRLWDHPDIVWGAWFVAAPDVAPLTKLGMIYNAVYVCLTQTRFKEMYIEVLGSGNDSNIYDIYKKLGLQEIATFHNFISPGKDMVVMRINLHQLRKSGKEVYDFDTVC